jgi:cytochrome b6-f complex iron-sulfur subunit
MANNNISRKDFFTALGLNATAIAVVGCMGCSKGSSAANNGTSPPSKIDFSLDLTASANAPLLSNGGYLATNGILVARTAAGTYLAVQQSCTHQSYPLVYNGSPSIFFCNNHGAEFSENGSVLSGPTNKSLTVYKTALTGNSLRIYS